MQDIVTSHEDDLVDAKRFALAKDAMHTFLHASYRHIAVVSLSRLERHGQFADMNVGRVNDETMGLLIDPYSTPGYFGT